MSGVNILSWQPYHPKNYHSTCQLLYWTVKCQKLDAMVTHQADDAAPCVLTVTGALKSRYLTMLLENRGYVFFIYSSLKLINKEKCKVLAISWPASTASDWKISVNRLQTHPASDQTDLGCVQTSLYGPTSTSKDLSNMTNQQIYGLRNDLFPPCDKQRALMI